MQSFSIVLSVWHVNKIKGSKDVLNNVRTDKGSTRILKSKVSQYENGFFFTFLNSLALQAHCVVPRLGIVCEVICVDP